MEIIKELKRIQRELIVPKNQINSHGKYKYRSLEDITEAFKKIDTEASLVLSDEIKEINNRFYVKATATIYLGDDKFSATGWARETQIRKGMDESQITGATSSYARKYAVNGLFSIDDSRDMDVTGDGKSNDSEANQKLLKYNQLLKKINETEDLEKLRIMYSFHKKNNDVKICNLILKKVEAVKSKQEKIKKETEKAFSGVEEIAPEDIDY